MLLKGLLLIAGLGAGLFAGFITAMASVVQAMLCDLAYGDYLRAMQGIITQGRKSRVVLVLLLAPLIVGLLALWLLASQGAWIAFGLGLAGLLCFGVGGLGVSRALNEPFYDRVMALEADAPPANWVMLRGEWLRLNLVRLGFSAVGAALMMAATLSM